MKNTHKLLQKCICSYLVEIKEKNNLKVFLNFFKKLRPYKIFSQFSSEVYETEIYKQS